MLVPRDALAASTVNGKIYTIGGGERSGPFSVVEEYDPATDTWTKKADMPTARAFLSTGVVNGKIYAIGGSRFNAPAYTAVEEYDPVTDTWTKKADMPARRTWSSTSVVDEKIYTFGGGSRQGGEPLSSLFLYDPVMDTWEVKDDMPVKMGGVGTSVIDGRIYVIGGTSVPYPYNLHLSTVWEYDPGFAPIPPEEAVPAEETTSVKPEGKLFMLWGEIRSE
jgi:N-acetylneuraminic acid mutarotase